MLSRNRTLRLPPEPPSTNKIDFLAQRVIRSIVEFTNKKINSSLPLVAIDRISEELYQALERISQEITEENHRSLVPHLIENEFYSSISLLQVDEMNAQTFNIQAILIKYFISYILDDDCEFVQYSSEISKILRDYLFNFVNRNNLLDYQIIYLNRLVTYMIKICSKYPSIFSHWLTTEKSNSLRPFPLFRIIFNFLKSKEYDQSVNLIKLLKLTNESPSLNSWFHNHEHLQELFEKEFTTLYNQAVENQRVNLEIKEAFIKCLDMFTEIIEVSSCEICFIYCQFFDESFLNIMLDGVLNSIMVSFMFIILQTLSNNKSCCKLLTKIISSKQFMRFLERIMEINYEINTLLSIIFMLFRSHEFTILKLISGDQVQSHHYLKIPPQIIQNIQVKTMSVLEDSITGIDMALLNFVNYNVQSIRLYWFDSNLLFPKFYLSLFLDYFKNYPNLNIILNDLSSTIFLKVNILANQNFRTVINYLYESYMKYLQLLKQHEKYKYDSLEIKKLRLNQYFTPHKNLLQQLEIENYQIVEELINYANLQENLQLFKSFLIDLYINTKFKYIDHAMI